MVPVIIEEDNAHILDDENDELYDDVNDDHHSNSSDDSAGKTTFARTPEHSDNEDNGCQGNTPTHDYPLQRDTPTKTNKQEQPTCVVVPLQDLSTSSSRHSMLSPLSGRYLNQNGLVANRNRPLLPISSSENTPKTPPLSSQASKESQPHVARITIT